MLISTGSVQGDGSGGRCDVLDEIKSASRGGQFNSAKIDAKIEQIVNDPRGLASLADLGDHPSHTASINGHTIVFWGIRAGQYRLYAFEWQGQCVIGACFATKKTQQTSKVHQKAMEAAARRVIDASVAGST